MMGMMGENRDIRDIRDDKARLSLPHLPYKFHLD